MNFGSPVFNRTKDLVEFDIFDNMSQKIGHIDAAGDKKGNFGCIIVIDPLHRGQGVGFSAFKHAFDLIDQHFKISKIKAVWNKDGFFTGQQVSQSSNLTIYQSNRLSMSDTDSALATPTGRWCIKLGFKNCQVVNDTPDKVEVFFT